MAIDRGTSPPRAASRAGSGGGGVAKREWGNHIAAVMGQLMCMSFGGRRPIHHIIPLAAKTRVLSRSSISSRHAFELTELLRSYTNC